MTPTCRRRTLTFSLTDNEEGGADNALFTIDASGNLLSFITAPDYENPQDADGDNVYEVEVEVSDGDNAIHPDDHGHGHAGERQRSGVRLGRQRRRWWRTARTVLTLAASDADLPAEALTFSLTDNGEGGADNALFTIDASGNLLSFITAPDYENPQDADGDNVYEVEVEVSDGDNAIPQTITVTVTPENDNVPVFDSADSASVVENSTDVLTLAASDADLPAEDLSFSLTDNPGTDNALFTIDASGNLLSFITAPDYENPQDADGDNVYEVEVEVSDGDSATTQPITVTVTPENDNLPAFDSADSASVAENSTDVLTLAASDADLPPEELTFSLTDNGEGGADNALFTIDASGNLLSFIDAPDFEDPQDADGDNVYEVEVEVSDGDNATTQTITVTVTPENDNLPAFDSAESATVAENSTDVLTLAASDADLPPEALTFSLTDNGEGGADNALFTIDASGNVLSFIDAPDFEDPQDADGDNVYEVEVEVSDGDNAIPQTITVTVTPQNDNAPMGNNDTILVDEGGTATALVGGANSVLDNDTDADVPNDNLTVDTTSVSVPSHGTLILNEDGSFSYLHNGSENFTDSFTYEVSDAAGATSQATVTIIINPVNDNAPVGNDDSVLVNEGGTATALVGGASSVLAQRHRHRPAERQPDGRHRSRARVRATAR